MAHKFERANEEGEFEERETSTTHAAPTPRRRRLFAVARAASALVVGFLFFVLLAVTLSRVNESRLELSTLCDDGEACTADYESQGSCVWRPLPNGASCTSPCYGGATACVRGRCVGERCVGACETAAECPTLRVTGVEKHASCTLSTCVYSVPSSLPVSTASCQDSLFHALCDAMLALDEPRRECVRISPLCEQQELVCVYSFLCAP